MAQPATLAARPLGADLAGAAAGILVLIGLLVLIVWPLAGMFAAGLLMVPPPAAVVLNTIAVTVVATVGALVMATILAAAVRAGVAGREALVVICRAGVFVPSFVVALAVLVLAGRERAGLPTLALAQAFAFLPHAFALAMRALAAVPLEAEQAAELLGASRWTVFRRVTLGLAGPGIIVAALVVAGLCLADVAAPLLVGGQQPMVVESLMLVGYVVAAGENTARMTAGAVALCVLAIAVAVAGRTWRYTTAPFAVITPPRPGPGASAARSVLASLAWLIAAVLVALWAIVPLASLAHGAGGVSLVHWRGLRGAAFALGDSLVVGVLVALLGALLALAVAWLAERRRGRVAAVMTVIARVPVAVPGLAASVGYLLLFDITDAGLDFLILLIAVWELPLMLRVAGNVLARSDRSREQAALTLGAGQATTLRRVVLPGLRPALAWLLAHGFATGVTAVSTVVVLAGWVGPRQFGVTHMLASASTGSVGGACAVATVLLAIAGGATLLGRAAAGRDSIPTLLA